MGGTLQDGLSKILSKAKLFKGLGELVWLRSQHCRRYCALGWVLVKEGGLYSSQFWSLKDQDWVVPSIWPLVRTPWIHYNMLEKQKGTQVRAEHT